MQMQTVRMAVHWRTLSTQLLKKQGWYDPWAGYPRLPALTMFVLVPLLYSGFFRISHTSASSSGWCGLHACEFYVIIGLIPTGGVLLSLPGRWQPCCGCLPNRESPGNVPWEKDPSPASGSFNVANPNGGVRRWEKPGVFTNLQRQDPKWMSLP